MDRVDYRTENEKSDVHLHVHQFIENNYRLFTVIGVFAGLSVYLTQLSEQNSASRIGIGASLFLFLSASIIGIIRANSAANTVLEHRSIKSFLWVVPYSIFMYAFVFLSVSIVLLINSKYAGEVGGIVGAGLIYAMIFVYWSIISARKWIRELNYKTDIGRLFRFSPYVATLPTGGWVYYRWSTGSIQPFTAAIGEVVGYTTGMVVTHFTFTVLTLLLISLGDRSLHRLKSRIKAEDEKLNVKANNSSENEPIEDVGEAETPSMEKD